MRPLQAHCHRGLGMLGIHERLSGAGPHRAVYRHHDVPDHGHDLLAPQTEGVGRSRDDDFEEEGYQYPRPYVVTQRVRAPVCLRSSVLSYPHGPAC